MGLALLALVAIGALGGCSSGALPRPSTPTASVGVTASPASTTSTMGLVRGRVTAGPTCPVERPGESACAARPVAGAVLVVRAVDGTERTRVTSDTRGAFSVRLAAGDYTLEPQPVEGLLGTAAPTSFSVGAGNSTSLDVSYDTGIR